MELQQVFTSLDAFVKEWIDNIKELKFFKAEIESPYDDDAWYYIDDIFEDWELAETFPIYPKSPCWLEIDIINEKGERLSLYICLDNKNGITIYFHSYFYFNFKGDLSICKSVIKLMYRFPETIRDHHLQYRWLALKEAGLI